MEEPQKINLLPALALGLVAAVHGATVAQRLPLRLRFNDDLQFNRLLFGVLAFAVMQFVMIPVWGALSDRLGRRRMIGYSLAASIGVSMLGFAPLLRLQLPQQFVIPLFSGLATAGLVLSISYCFSLIKDGARNDVLGSILCGFFGGAIIMLSVRFLSGAVSAGGMALLNSIILVALAGAAMASVRYGLSDVRPTSVSFTGMNALHGLWHGFGESDRGARAVWWKIFLGSMGVADGLFVSVLPALGRAVSLGKGAYRVTVFALVVLLFAAALSSVGIARWSPGRIAARFLAPFSAGLAIIAALLAGVAGSPTVLYFVMFLAGAATGTSLFTALHQFESAARNRSAGAEMGAVVAIWFGGFFAALLLAMSMPQELQPLPIFLAVGAGLVTLLAGILTARLPRD